MPTAKSPSLFAAQFVTARRKLLCKGVKYIVPHHIVSRDDPAVRYDVRNGICLSFATHFAVERGDLRIEGSAWFTVGGVRYIDASAPVRFVQTSAQRVPTYP